MQLVYSKQRVQRGEEIRWQWNTLRSGVRIEAHEPVGARSVDPLIAAAHEVSQLEVLAERRVLLLIADALAALLGLAAAALEYVHVRLAR